MLREELADIRLAATDPLADQLVEVADHLAVRGQVLRGRGPDGVAHPTDELVEDLLAEPLDECLEAGARVGLQEVVLAQVADALADVARKGVEPVQALGGDVAQHLLEVRVGGRRGGRVGRGGGGRVGRGVGGRVGRGVGGVGVVGARGVGGVAGVGDVRGGVGARRRRGGARARPLEAPLDAGALLRDDLIELATDVTEDVAQVEPLAQLLTAPA